MDVRFVILHPSDPRKILWSTALLRAIKSEHPNAWIVSLIPDPHGWMLKENPHVDEIIPYTDQLMPLIHPIHDQMPDYLIDLVGGWKTWRFRNRLKVVDFTLKKRDQPDFQNRMFDLVKLFDVDPDGKGEDLFLEPFDRSQLPESFEAGYLVACLDTPLFPERPVTSMWVNLLNLIERPTVLFGDKSMRPMADTIAKQVGCTVFPTCGDFEKAKIAALIQSASGIITFEAFWPVLTALWDIPTQVIRSVDPEGWDPDPSQVANTARNWKMKGS